MSQEPHAEEIVTISELAYWKFARDGLVRAKAEERASAQDAIDRIRPRLIERHGLKSEFFCWNIPAMLWLSTEPKLYSIFNPVEAVPRELVNLSNALGNLSDSAEELLEGTDLERFLSSVYADHTNVLGLADDVVGRAKRGAGVSDRYYRESFAQLRQQYLATRKIYVRLTQRRAQFSYFEGMVVGAAALTVFALLLVIAAPFLPRVDVNAVDIVAGTVIFGALGAIFSVLARMTAGSLRLRAESGKQMLRTLGGVRPVVGAVAGVGLYLFIEGEALDILKKPQGSADEYSYYGALAFLAGFSERFFQDMLVSKTTQDQTAADQEHEDEEAAPAPPAEALPALEPAEAAPSNPPSARKRRNRQGEAAGGMPSDEPTGPNRPDGPEWGVG